MDSTTDTDTIDQHGDSAKDAPLLSPPGAATIASGRSDGGDARDQDRSNRHSMASSSSGSGIISSQPTSILMLADVPREPTGSTIVEPDSVFDDSGRSFHGYKEGKYFLPNDAVSQPSHKTCTEFGERMTLM
jgi:hypothetical protein